MYSQWSWGRKQTTFTDTYVQNKASRTETREIVLSTPAGNLFLSVTRSRAHGSCRDLDHCVRPGFMCPGTNYVAEKCSYAEKSWQKYEKNRNIRMQMYVVLENVFAVADMDNGENHV